jgi:RHS repeat-associated protein
LNEVVESAATTTIAGDIEQPTSGQRTYTYDQIGNLTGDIAEEIQEIKWTVYGKIKEVIRTTTSSKPEIEFEYNAVGQRVLKSVTQNGNTVKTWYIRDASGNIMSTYTETTNDLIWESSMIYGSSRVGAYNPGVVLNQSGGDPDILEVIRGNKHYEMANHLGNVLATITDRKIGSNGSTTGNYIYFSVDYMSVSDYYPFGMMMQERSFTCSTNENKFSFNGKEMDNETYQGSIAFEARIYDARLGKFLSVDPWSYKYRYQSTYVFAHNSPIVLIDYLGLGRENDDSDSPPETNWHKKDRWERKFDRKYKRWEKNNRSSLSEVLSENYETFKNSKNWLGRTRSETRWFKKYENHTGNSPTTNWVVETSVPSTVLTGGGNRTTGTTTDVHNVGGSRGTMTITWDMQSIPDRLQVINTATGEILFDTQNLPEANSSGEVLEKNGSGQVVNFNLGSGNQSITVIVNPGNSSDDDTHFHYKITLTNIEPKVQTVEDASPE